MDSDESGEDEASEGESDKEEETPKRKTSNSSSDKQRGGRKASNASVHSAKKDETDSDEDESMDDEDDDDLSDEDEEEDEPCSSKTPDKKSHKKVPGLKKKRKQNQSKKERRLVLLIKRIQRKTHDRGHLHSLKDIASPDELLKLRQEVPKMAFDRDAPQVYDAGNGSKANMNMLAFNPMRDDFEYEWYNNAEKCINKFTFESYNPKRNEGHDLESVVKFVRIGRYGRILARRRAVHQALREHGKIDEFFNFMKKATVERLNLDSYMKELPRRDRLITRAEQALAKTEVTELRNHATEFARLAARAKQLQLLQRRGITSLEGYHKWDNPPEEKKSYSKSHKGRKADAKKARLSWDRYKRWQAKQLAGST